jgi:hypothetical protein
MANVDRPGALIQVNWRESFEPKPVAARRIRDRHQLVRRQLFDGRGVELHAVLVFPL